MDLLDEAVARLRSELVEDAPPVSLRVDDAVMLHGVRVVMRSSEVAFDVEPQRVENVLGFRAFVDPDELVLVSSLVADMRERVKDAFDIARWCVPRGYAFCPLGLVSWLFPLKIRLRRGPNVTTVDVVVVTQDAPDAARLT